MERKTFITTTLGASVAVAAAAATLAATPAPNDGGLPGEGSNPCMPQGNNFGGGAPRAQRSPSPNAVMEHAERNLSRLIEVLERDPSDYDGHKSQAIGYLQQALTQVQDALSSAGVTSPQQGLMQSQP
jgi:hypothetical protein